MKCTMLEQEGGKEVVTMNESRWLRTGSARLPAWTAGLFLLAISLACSREDESARTPASPDDGSGGTMDVAETPPSGEDALPADAAWPGCDVVGQHCTPEDTVIFMAACFHVAGGSLRFPVYSDCGFCECGFVQVPGPCPDEHGSCDAWTGPETPVLASEFCATGRRVLCANGTGEWARTRLGCCDEAGLVYCERDPAPDSNRCL